jgi:hypothetical protein
MRASSGKRRGGFILPTTLLVVTVLTVMLAAGFILVSAEYRVTDNSFASSRALAIAQAGLQNYFTSGHPLTGAADSTIYTFSKGYARVAAFKLRDPTATAQALWVVRSIGFDTVRASAGQPNGQRAIAQFAEFQPGVLPVLAAVVAPNGVFLSGSSLAAPSGIDRCGSSNIYGVTGGLSGILSPAPLGSPAGEDPRYTTAAQIIDATRINWPALLGGQFTPDYTTSPPCLHSMQTSGGFPVGLCNGNASLSGRRYGLLVVTGNVTLESGVHWDGILVVGGKVNANRDDVRVHGIMITGLNGPSVAPDTLKRGNTFQASSCYSDPSVATLSGLVPIKNAWVDNWSTY